MLIQIQWLVSRHLKLNSLYVKVLKVKKNAFYPNIHGHTVKIDYIDITYRSIYSL